jgi:CBS domain-containing protein
MLDSLSAMGETGTPDQRLCALTRAIMARQGTTKPVHEWELASVDEFASWRESYRKVGQFMTTDLFTVRPGDLVDLAASLMDWRHIRHVPVEDNEGRLVGLVSHRALLRLLGQGLKTEDPGVPVRQIMKPDPITVTPETPTLQAIELMRKHRVGCLPVTEEDRLVGIITERDLLRVSAMLFEQHLRETTPK